MAFFMPNKIAGVIIIILCSIINIGTNAEIMSSSAACTRSMIQTYTPCLNYVTASSDSLPTQDCCDSLKSIMAESVDCGCLIVTGNVPFSIPFFNRSLAISLPGLCQNSVPLQCKASGDQLPAPGPALLGTTLAPTAAHSHSAKASKEPAESTDVESESPPEVSLGPSANPGIRPVVSVKSNANPTTFSLSCVVIMSVLGIMANKLFW